MPYHANARAAASFAEAAGLQGKYWEMHDKLYETQRTWESLPIQERTDYFATLIQQIGGDQDKARADIESEAIKKKVAYDSALADLREVSGTPSLYLNGEKVEAFMDGKVVSSNTQGATQLWADADLLEKHVIIPALEKAGIEY
jgi:protein-disulfide isomerase